MNRARLLTIISCAAAIAGGFAAGRWRPDDRTPVGTAAGETPAPLPRNTPSTPSNDPQHGLARLIRLLTLHQREGDPELLRQIERLPTAQLRQLFLDLEEGRPRHYDGSSEALAKLLDGVARELFRRDGEAAIDPILGVPDEVGRRVLFSHLIRAAAQADPAIARSWAERYEGQLRNMLMSAVSHEALQAAALRGTDDFLEICTRFDTTNFMLGPASFADDFDFPRAIAASRSADLYRSLLESWAYRDMDAAWATAREGMKASPSLATSHTATFYQAALTTRGEESAAAWLVENLDHVPQNLRAISVGFLAARTPPSPDQSLRLVRSLPETAERVGFVASLLTYQSRDASHVGILKALPSDTEREAAFTLSVEQIDGQWGQPGTPEHTAALQQLRKLADELRLPQESRDRIFPAE